MKKTSRGQGRRSFAFFNAILSLPVILATLVGVAAKSAPAQTVSVGPYQPNGATNQQTAASYSGQEQFGGTQFDSFQSDGASYTPTGFEGSQYDPSQFVGAPYAPQSIENGIPTDGTSSFIPGFIPQNGGFQEYPYDAFGNSLLPSGVGTYNHNADENRVKREEEQAETDRSSRPSALEIWTAFLFGRKSKTSPTTSSLFSRPSQFRRQGRPDQMEINPIFSFLRFGRDDQETQSEVADAPLYNDGYAPSDDFYAQQGDLVDGFTDQNFSVPSYDYGQNGANYDYQGQIINDFGQYGEQAPVNNQFFEDDARGYGEFSPSLSSARRPQTFGPQFSREVASRSPQNNRAPRKVASRGGRVDSERFPQFARSEDRVRRPSSQVSLNEQSSPAYARKNLNVNGAISEDVSSNSGSENELANARKTRLQQLNETLAAQRPEEFARRIRQAAATSRNENVSRTASPRSEASKIRQTTFEEKTSIPNRSNFAIPSRPNALQISDRSFVSTHVARLPETGALVQPPSKRAEARRDNNNQNPNPPAVKKIAAPRRVPTFNSSQVVREEPEQENSSPERMQETRQQAEFVQPLSQSTPKQSPSSKIHRSRANFLDPKELGQ